MCHTDHATDPNPTVLAANPYRWIEGLYEAETIKLYVGKNRIDVPPHIFAVAESAFRTMMTEARAEFHGI